MRAWTARPVHPLPAGSDPAVDPEDKEILAVVAGIINWLLGALGITFGGGILAAIVNLVVAAVVLLISGRIVPGLRVKGFGGALVGAIALAVVGWLIALVLGGLIRA
jgi:uncharacterized membrane protein YvlD (DUF360 family)